MSYPVSLSFPHATSHHTPPHSQASRVVLTAASLTPLLAPSPPFPSQKCEFSTVQALLRRPYPSTTGFWGILWITRCRRSSNHPSHSSTCSPGCNTFGLPLRVSPSGAHLHGLHPQPPHQAARPRRRQPGIRGPSPPPGAACVYAFLPVTAAAGPHPHSNAASLGGGPRGDGGVRRSSPGARYGGERWGASIRRASCVPGGLHAAARLQDPSRLLRQPWPQPLPRARRGARVGRRHAGRRGLSSGARPPRARHTSVALGPSRLDGRVRHLAFSSI